MNLRVLTSKVSGSSRIYKTVLIVVVLTATVSALRVSFNLGYNLGTFEHSELIHRTCCVNFKDSFLIPLTVGLIVSALCLLTRTLAGLIFSTLSLIWVASVYVLWYRGTLSVIRNAEVDSFYSLPDQSQHLLPLNGATWWDLAVLAIVIVVWFWHIKVLVSTIKRSGFHRN